MSAKSKIIIVEDEAIIALTLTTSLTNLGYSVSAHFASGEEFMEYIDNARESDFPDLILMDIMLSGKLDGIETAKLVKAKFDIPVIYLTALSNEAILQKAKITEPYAYILKPFNEREMHISIEIALYKFKSELIIKKSETKFRNIFNSITSIFYCTDLMGKIEMVSPSVKTILGYDPDQLAGKNILDLYLVPDNRDILIDHLHKYGFINNFETEIKHAEGRIVEVSADCKYLMNEKNEPTGICGIVKDITNLNKLERDAKNYLRAIEQSNEIIVITDKNGVIKFANHKTESVTGFSKEELMGQTPRLFKSGILGNNFYKKVWEDLLAGKIVESVFPNRTKHGRMYYEEKVITPIRGKDGKINLFISTGRDITDKIKTRRRIELLNHNSKLKEAETNKNIILSFIRGQEEERKRVSTEIHDGLCQILSIAKMTLNNKKQKAKGSSATDLNELIEASITEAKRIANNLSPAVLTDFGLAAGLKKLVLINSTNTNVKIHPRISATMPRLPVATELALFRITQEAITNSLKHARCSKIIVRLYHSEGYIVLAVTDNGKGIWDNINSNTTIGLGLNNMTQRSNLIGAKFQINSKQNKYTSIHVKLLISKSL